MGTSFNPTILNTNVWIKGNKCAYKYIGTHTDDILVAALGPPQVKYKLRETFNIRYFVVPKVCLCNYYKQVMVDDFFINVIVDIYLRGLVEGLRASWIVSFQEERWLISPGKHI